jgi:hypothetical protein
MSSVSNVLPFAVGVVSTSGTNAALVGQLYKDFSATYGERIFRLARCGATALPANATVVSAVSSGKKTWVCSTTTAGSHSQVAGVLPIEYTGTAAVAIDGYFLLQVGGNCPIIAGDTLFSSLTGVEARLVTGSGGSGHVRSLAAFTTASTTEESGVFALASNTIAATATGVLVRALLRVALDD